MRYFGALILVGVPLWYLILIFCVIFTTPTRPSHKHNIDCFVSVFQDERVATHLKSVAAGMVLSTGAYIVGYGGCKVLAPEKERQHCSNYGDIAGIGASTLLLVTERDHAILGNWIEKVANFGEVFREENMMISRFSGNPSPELELEL